MPIEFSLRSPSKGLWSAFALLASCCACIAPAQAAQFDVKGTVNKSCNLGPAPGSFIFSTVVGTNGKLSPTLDSQSWTISGSWCNIPSTIRISATALRITSPAPKSSLPSGQSQTINFRAQAAGWAPSPAVVTTGETTSIGTGALFQGAAQVQSGPKVGSVNVTVGNFIVAGQVGNSPGQLKPIPGTYSATITVTLGVQ
jgi:hypothetical protein